MPKSTITLAQAQKIIDLHTPSHPTVVSVDPVKDHWLGYVLKPKTYSINVASSLPISTYTLILSTPSHPSPDPYSPNSVETIDTLLALLHDHTTIPLPPSHLDTSQTIIPYHYLLFTPPHTATTTLTLTITEARKAGLLTPQDSVLIDLQLGTYLAQIHQIQNDWFGPPLQSEDSWQEFFTQRTESLLDAVENDRSLDTLGLPYDDIRRSLSRAIASFLFDDAEVPSLTTFTSSEDDVLVSLPPAPSSAKIISVQPTLTHAIWGDPLLESFFLPPGPSPAFLEGYAGAGGGPLLIFPRQKTKRLWYTIYMALVVLVEGSPDGVEGNVAWAEDVLRNCVGALKDAPCY